MFKLAPLESNVFMAMIIVIIKDLWLGHVLSPFSSHTGISLDIGQRGCRQQLLFDTIQFTSEVFVSSDRSSHSDSGLLYIRALPI